MGAPTNLRSHWMAIGVLVAVSLHLALAAKKARDNGDDALPNCALAHKLVKQDKKMGLYKVCVRTYVAQAPEMSGPVCFQSTPQ